MGKGKFDALQQAIVRAGFKRHEGEPDLFCYTPGGAWFFAEAKTDADALRRSQKEWFHIAEATLGPAGQVFLCRVQEKRELRAASRPFHTVRRKRVVGSTSGAV